MRKFNLKIKEGKISFSSDYHKALFNEFLKEHEGKILDVSLFIPIRTNQQNRFYWNYLAIIETETGNNASDMHEFFKRKLLPPKWIKVMDEDIKIPSSTTELSKIEFGEYMDKISALTGVAVPDPEKWMEENDIVSNKKPYY